MVDYHGLGRHNLPPLALLTRPQLNGGTLARHRIDHEAVHADGYDRANAVAIVLTRHRDLVLYRDDSR